MCKRSVTMEEVVFDYLTNDPAFRAYYLDKFAPTLERPCKIENIEIGLISYLLEKKENNND